MVNELKLMELASDQQKIQKHNEPLFPCSAYYTDWKKTGINSVPWHWHNELEFMFVVEGSMTVHFGDVDEPLKENDGAFINAKNLHAFNMLDCEHCRARSLVVDPLLLTGGADTIYFRKYIEPVITAVAFSGMVLHHDIPGHRTILEHIKTAHDYCMDEPDGYEYDVRYHLSKALHLICADSREELARLENVSVHSRRIREMLNYIYHHYDEDISLKDLAASAGICEREAQRCFKTDLGYSPIGYLQRYRIHIACKLLLENGDSVLDTGLACGFPNPSHFCRIFRKYMGVTPLSYRKRGKARGFDPPGPDMP